MNSKKWLLFTLCFFFASFELSAKERSSSYPLKNYSNTVLLSQGDTIKLELYRAPLHAQSPQLTWSISKSLFQAMIGRATRLGYTRLNDSICKKTEVYWSYCGELVRDHLNFNSSLAWNEGYEEKPLMSSIVAYLTLYSQLSIGNFLHLHKKLPQKQSSYSSGDTLLLASYFKDRMGPKHDSFLRNEFSFFENTVFEKNLQGEYISSSYAYMSARDLAQLGRLYLPGEAEGRSFFPRGWVSNTYKALRSDARFAKKGSLHLAPHWRVLATKDTDLTTLKQWPPEDRLLVAVGHWGQILVVDPIREVVLVHFGEDRKKQLNLIELINDTYKHAGISSPFSKSSKKSYLTQPRTYRSVNVRYSFKDPVKNLMKVAKKYHSKHLCSCLFVQELPEKYCRYSARPAPSWIKGLMKVNIEYARKRVHVGKQRHGVESSAYRGASEGCTLLN